MHVINLGLLYVANGSALKLGCLIPLTSVKFHQFLTKLICSAQPRADDCVLTLFGTCLVC